MYFKNIEKIDVDVNGDGINETLSNLAAAVKLSDTATDEIAFYETVEVQDGERPDQLSLRLYGTTKYHWTFLLLNRHIKNVWDDWPMAFTQLVEYCTNKYSDLAANTNDALSGKFVIGETVTGALSGATGTIKEIHVNNSYLIVKKLTGTFTAGGESLSVTKTAETATTTYPVGTVVSMTASSVKSAAYAYHHHTDNTTSRRVPKRTSGTTATTFLEWETSIHDNNKNMKVIKSEHIRTISKKFIKLMQ
jgi:hypothetical protein